MDGQRPVKKNRSAIFSDSSVGCSKDSGPVEHDTPFICRKSRRRAMDCQGTVKEEHSAIFSKGSVGPIQDSFTFDSNTTIIVVSDKSDIRTA